MGANPAVSWQEYPEGFEPKQCPCGAAWTPHCRRKPHCGWYTCRRGRCTYCPSTRRMVVVDK